MKTLSEAISKAKRLSKGKFPDTTFVVYSKDEEDIPGNNYHACFEYDLHTFYAGIDHDRDVLFCSDEY